ncbi:hypothetical protein C1H46_014049 [Malus baccata]|uniref:INO80 complex subunit B-like conserved region domain-containing protein n=1 Tax=Malus baccata TaxID=106549 RepID=A0A540MNJ0_MALBA|nr:hypothetical protein C1H46_014049 [Malus baccata]
MEDLSNNHRLDSISSAVRKKRSQTFRRPRPDSYTELHDESPLSSTTPSDDQSKVSSDENAGCDANSKRKELSLNECMARGSSAAGNGEKPHKKDSTGGGCNSFYKNEPGRNESNNKRSSEGCLAPANWKSSSLMKDDLISESISAGAFNGRNGESPSTRLSGLDGFGNENKVKKVKLKVGGVTRTIQANSTLNGPTEEQKEKLTDVEQQLKKAEAAQRRRMQVEKATRESEAEAIRKILGQDSSRKKREDKIKKRQEEIAQERAANALTLPPNTIRTLMGPAGTVVTFSNDMGLPSLFDPKPCSYPTQRENCAGPSCINPYKNRDSKSQLPLCSLKCYKAIQEKTAVGTTC